MNFASPWWLCGLGTLILPILLHLWRQPRLVRIQVGSLRFVPGAAHPPRKSWRLRDRWLLVLRMLVLIFLFCWLADPRHTPQIKPVSENWLLVERGQHAEQKAGYRTRIIESRDWWSVVAEADRQLTPESSLAVLAAPRLTDLQGQRPALQHRVEWLPGQAPVAAKWVARVQPSRAATGLTSAEETSYEWLETGKPAAVSLALPVISIVLDPGQEQEAANVAAALEAALESSGGAAEIRRSAPQQVEESDLLVWLSDRDVSAEAKVILTVARIKDLEAVTTQLQNEPIGIRQIDRNVEALPPSGEATTRFPPAPILRSSDGRPLLTSEQKGRQRIFHFHSRFLIAAGDLVESGVLVAWMIDDLLPAVPGAFRDVVSNAGKDLRAVSLDEVQEQVATVKSFPPLPEEPKSLRLVFWTLLGLVFLAERVVSSRGWKVIAPRTKTFPASRRERQASGPRSPEL